MPCRGPEEMSDKFVTVASFDEPCKAHIAEAKLESEGIKCFLSGENFVATYWLYSRIEGGIKLKVMESDSKAAVDILQRREVPSNAQQQSELGEYDLTCPKCRSENIEYERFSWKMALLSILLFRLPLTWLKEEYKCLDCGYVWK
jgi:Zn finger protein HypA/HybF involved in hydrogenase expression